MKDEQRSRALQACRLLIDAYTQGAINGGSVEWDDIDQAYQAAVLALRREED